MTAPKCEKFLTRVLARSSNKKKPGLSSSQMLFAMKSMYGFGGKNVRTELKKVLQKMTRKKQVVLDTTRSPVRYVLMNQKAPINRGSRRDRKIWFKESATVNPKFNRRGKKKSRRPVYRQYATARKSVNKYLLHRVSEKKHCKLRSLKPRSGKPNKRNKKLGRNQKISYKRSAVRNRKAHSTKSIAEKKTRGKSKPDSRKDYSVTKVMMSKRFLNYLYAAVRSKKRRQKRAPRRKKHRRRRTKKCITNRCKVKAWNHANTKRRRRRQKNIAKRGSYKNSL